jgi:hypothetical protein
MTRFVGKGLVVMVENSSSSEVAFTNVISADVDCAYDEVPFEGDDVKASGAGPLNATVTVEYEFDDTATTGNHVVLGGIDGDNTNPRFVRVRPVGTGEGKIEFAMDSILLKYGPTGIARDGRVVCTAIFKNHMEASADPAWGTQSA